MGGSQTHNCKKGRAGGKVCMGIYSVQIRSTSDDQLKRRKTLQRGDIRRLLTLPRNSQEETPFSLTYGSEAVVPIAEAIDDMGRTQETTKKGKEIASIKKAHYRNKLQKYHNTRNNHTNYIVGDFVLFPTRSQEQQGPHMISEVHKDEFYTLVNVAEDSLIQKAKGTSLPLGHTEVDKIPSDGEGFIISAGEDIGFENGAEDGVASWEEGTCIWVLEGAGFCRVGASSMGTSERRSRHRVCSPDNLDLRFCHLRSIKLLSSVKNPSGALLPQHLVRYHLIAKGVAKTT
ncbi:hypothetical protein Tco_0374036 [Tanacetum coccineum]